MQIVWELDNLEQLDDNKLDVRGRPAVIAGPYGPAIEFDEVRLNRVCWFKGAIGRIRFTAGVLAPEEFMR
ncbi:MAG: hypothetical protein F4Z57_09925 [Gemmatimonadetes bacterium]|nr:hypothetical protein [Gemmatimonadota bacterium]MYC71599.1 hypothetical protein [Gemmatimonadota bacterium]